MRERRELPFIVNRITVYGLMGFFNQSIKNMLDNCKTKYKMTSKMFKSKLNFGATYLVFKFHLKSDINNEFRCVESIL